jgi:hypothetical protein
MLTEKDIEKAAKLLGRIKDLRSKYDRLSNGDGVSVHIGGRLLEVSGEFDAKVRGFAIMEIGQLVSSLTDELTALGVQAPDWMVGGTTRTTTMMKPKSLPESGFYKDEDDD